GGGLSGGTRLTESQIPLVVPPVLPLHLYNRSTHEQYHWFPGSPAAWGRGATGYHICLPAEVGPKSLKLIHSMFLARRRLTPACWVFLLDIRCRPCWCPPSNFFMMARVVQHGLGLQGDG